MPGSKTLNTPRNRAATVRERSLPRLALSLLVSVAIGSFAKPCHAQPAAPAFDGRAALEATRRAVAFGPRPAGSPELAKLRASLLADLRKLKCQVEEDSFTAPTPLGPRAMTNIIAKFPGTSGRILVVSGHYDTYQ